MILIINVCREKLHELEFVKPIEHIVKENFVTKHYFNVSEQDLENSEKVIICGTSLKDNQFMEDIGNFSWLKNFDKPVLGICAGMQILGSVFGGNLKKKTEIGFFFENFEKEFLGLLGGEEVQEVYHLHNNYVDFKDLEMFDIVVRGNFEEKIAQAVKHREKEIYGVLFHPEVRQKEMIRNFING